MNILGDKNLSLVQKIALAGLFTALAAILNKVLAINYIAAVPFVRISFGGPAIIIFASILLGPIFGALVGGLSDILGYFVFDLSGFPYAPWITFTYILLGALSYFVFYLVKKVKNQKLMMLITYLTMGIVFLIATLFITLNDKIVWFSHTYTLDLALKISLPILMFVLFVFIIVFNFFFNRHFQKKMTTSSLVFSIYQLSFSLFIIEVLIIVFFGSLMKAILFGMELYPLIVFFQAMTMLFNIPFNTFIISYIMLITKRYYKYN
ncbi:MAG: ECF transporter S component [Bacilli bacterium]